MRRRARWVLAATCALVGACVGPAEVDTGSEAMGHDALSAGSRLQICNGKRVVDYLYQCDGQRAPTLVEGQPYTLVGGFAGIEEPHLIRLAVHRGDALLVEQVYMDEFKEPQGLFDAGVSSFYLDVGAARAGDLSVIAQAIRPDDWQVVMQQRSLLAEQQQPTFVEPADLMPLAEETLNVHVAPHGGAPFIEADAWLCRGYISGTSDDMPACTSIGADAGGRYHVPACAGVPCTSFTLMVALTGVTAYQGMRADVNWAGGEAYIDDPAPVPMTSAIDGHGTSWSSVPIRLLRASNGQPIAYQVTPRFYDADPSLYPDIPLYPLGAGTTFTVVAE